MSTDGVPDPKHTIGLANIDRGTPEWRLHCHHGADEFRCYTETGEVDPLHEGECVLADWWGEHSIDLVDIREPISALPIPVDANWSGDSWDLTLATAGLRVVPEDRPAQCPSLEPVFAQLPSAPEIARWFVETEWAGKFQNLGGSAVTLSVDPWCSVWHLATVDHDEQMHYLLDVHTDGSHDLLYVTAGLREEMGCEWRQRPSAVMPWGYEALVWFAERIEFANESQGVPLVWMDALDNPLAAGVPALDDDTRREVEALIREIQQSRYHFGYVAHTKTLDAIERHLAYLGGTE